jgi:TetR/AcrR family transcriptional regulator of autoinduction and epiphytic fitness
MSNSNIMTIEGAARPGPDPRRQKLLDAALTVFLRFGFRKTSMDEVARAAHISRQGLYLHFKTKEELFQATVEHLLRDAQTAAERSLCDASRPLEQRLLGAFDAVVGRFVGMLGADTADLAQAGSLLVGDMIAEHELAFAEAVAKALRGSGLLGAYRTVGLSARQLADTLYATARGLKYSCATRAEFVERMGVAVRALCAPLGAAP